MRLCQRNREHSRSVKHSQINRDTQELYLCPAVRVRDTHSVLALHPLGLQACPGLAQQGFVPRQGGRSLVLLPGTRQAPSAAAGILGTPELPPCQLMSNLFV